MSPGQVIWPRDVGGGFKWRQGVCGVGMAGLGLERIIGAITALYLSPLFTIGGVAVPALWIAPHRVRYEVQGSSWW